MSQIRLLLQHLPMCGMVTLILLSSWDPDFANLWFFWTRDNWTRTKIRFPSLVKRFIFYPRFLEPIFISFWVSKNRNCPCILLVSLSSCTSHLKALANTVTNFLISLMIGKTGSNNPEPLIVHIACSINSKAVCDAHVADAVR